MYFIYAKQEDMKRFKPTNLREGTIVNRIIYATPFFDDEEAQYTFAPQNTLTKAKEILKELKENVKNTQFKIMKAR